MINNLNELTTHPVAVYDTELKKLVLLFSTSSACAVYCFDKRKYSVYKMINSKSKNRTNVFNRPLAFRNATTEQKKLLNDEIYVCFDNNFKRTNLSLASLKLKIA